MKRLIVITLLFSLPGCVAAPYAPSYAEPYPGYFGGAAYDAYPYSYYYGHYGAYPVHTDPHRHYNWGYWQGDGHWHGQQVAQAHVEEHEGHSEGHEEHSSHH